MADLRGRRGRAPPPRAQNFFIFMQFSGKIGQIIGWRPPSGVGAPSSGILDPPLVTAASDPISLLGYHPLVPGPFGGRTGNPLVLSLAVQTPVPGPPRGGGRKGTPAWAGQRYSPDRKVNDTTPRAVRLLAVRQEVILVLIKILGKLHEIEKINRGGRGWGIALWTVSNFFSKLKYNS